MADDSNPKENSKMIFENITFFMRPCKERQELRSQIEGAGGKVTSKATTECYKLAEKGSIVSREGYISTDFVEDCIKQKKLLSIETYRVKPGTVARAESDKSFACSSIASSDDSFEHASVIIKTTAKECKGRTKYTKEEDVAMMTYLIEENRYQGVMGKRVWKDMVMMNITGHSAESMSARYRKYILHNLDNYKYDIEKSWMSRLQGYVEREKEPEFSFDALFPQPRKKPPLQMTTSSSVRQKDRQDNTSDKTTKSAKSADKTNKHTVLGDKTHTHANSSDKATKQVNSCDKSKTLKKSIDIIKNNTLDINNVLSKPAKRKHKSAKDNVDSSEQIAADEIDGAEDTETSATGLTTTMGERQKSPAKVVDIEELDDGTLVDKCDDYEFDSWDSEFETSLLAANNKAQKRPVKSKYFTSSPKRQKQSGKDSVTATIDNQTDSHNSANTKTKGNGNDSNSSADLVMMDSPRLRTESQETEDSFDDMLESYLGDDKEQRDDSTNSNVCEANKQSSAANNSRSGKRVCSSSERGKDDKSAKRDTSNKEETNRHDKDKGRQTRSTRSSSKPKTGNPHINLSLSDEEEEETRSETDDNDRDAESPNDMETSQYTVNNTRVQEIVQTCRTIARKYGLEAGFVKQLLYGFSGDFAQTLRWIELGPMLGGRGPWTDSDDEQLVEADPDMTKALKAKHGINSYNARLLFLEGL